MDYPAGFLEPKELPVSDQKGVEKIFLLSKFPSTLGRELVAKYPVANMPKLGDYAVSEDVMLKLMSRVAVQVGDKWLPLSNKTLVDNHCSDWEQLGKVEGAMWEHNCSFFGNGKASIFFGDIAQNLRQYLTSILTASLAQLSAKEKQP